LKKFREAKMPRVTYKTKQESSEQERASEEGSIGIIPSTGEISSEIAFVVEGLDKEATLDYAQISSGSTNAGTGSVSWLLNTSIPKTKKGRIKKCYTHYEYDDLLSDLIDIKVNMSNSGLSASVKTPIDSNITEEEQKEIISLQSRINSICKSIDISKLADDLLRDWFIADSMVLYWRVSSGKTNNESSPDSSPLSEDQEIPGLVEICSLCPGDINWDNSLGNDILSIDIPKSLKEMITDAFRGANSRSQREEVYRKLNECGVGTKWINAVMKGDGTVLLRREDGDNWIIRTKARKNHGLADPSMRTIFLPLESRKMLSEGDFTACFLMKHFIMLIKQGESIDTGPMAGSTKNWLKPGEAKKLLKCFSTVNKALRAAVNHTTEIEFVFPPKDMFDDGKYQKVEKRIFWWSGVSEVIISGTESNFSSGSITIKKTISKVFKARQELAILFSNFFLHETIKKHIGIKNGYDVKLEFDNNVLTDQRQLLEEVKFLYESAVLDPRSAAKELKRDADTLKVSTIQSRKENEQLQVWEPVGGQDKKSSSKVSSGNDSTGGKEGRPANEGTEVNEDTRTQYPSSVKTDNN
jgi:hypothetical protein